MIVGVSDQLRGVEISLFEVDQDEAEAAKARLRPKGQRSGRDRKKKESISGRRRSSCARNKPMGYCPIVIFGMGYFFGKVGAIGPALPGPSMGWEGGVEISVRRSDIRV
jgi:hypothetical protein